MSETKKTQYHDNGTVSYWNEFQQCWCRRTSIITESDLVGMDEEEKQKILNHIQQNWNTPLQQTPHSK